MTFHIKIEAQSDSFGEKLKHKSKYFSHYFRETNFRFFVLALCGFFVYKKAQNISNLKHQRRRYNIV